MNKSHTVLISLSLFALGLLHLLNVLNLVGWELVEIYGIIFMIYGLATVFSTMGRNQRGRLLFAFFMFFIGVTLFIISNYEIHSPEEIVFICILFTIGGSFIILFIDNTNVKIFLAGGIILIFIGIVPLFLTDTVSLFSFSNSAASILLNFWYLLLIPLGAGILLSRKK